MVLKRESEHHIWVVGHILTVSFGNPLSFANLKFKTEQNLPFLEPSSANGLNYRLYDLNTQDGVMQP